MEKALEIQQQVQAILGTDEVYLVGGSVRDIVMGNEPKDYDFTTPMLPDDVEKAVQKAGRRSYAIGKKFGTIGFKVATENKLSHEYVEVTTFRSEVYTSKSRKPEVQFVPTLEEDLARRDFTFNAMVLKSDGKIYDPYGGRLDIMARLIKTVGLPKDRIAEDSLRMLRAARFAARYDFEIDANFIGKARQLADRIFDVSVERWVLELDKLLMSEHAYEGLEALHAMGLLQRILPELNTTVPTLINSYEGTIDEKWAHLLKCTEESLNDVITQKARTVNYINGGIVARLKFSNARRDLILNQKKSSPETIDL